MLCCKQDRAGDQLARDSLLDSAQQRVDTLAFQRRNHDGLAGCGARAEGFAGFFIKQIDLVPDLKHPTWFNLAYAKAVEDRLDIGSL